MRSAISNQPSAISYQQSAISPSVIFFEEKSDWASVTTINLKQNPSSGLMADN
jgi:hypothetical protein